MLNELSEDDIFSPDQIAQWWSSYKTKQLYQVAKNYANHIHFTPPVVCKPKSCKPLLSVFMSQQGISAVVVTPPAPPAITVILPDYLTIGI